ncbi:MAG TPA: hypothetical protein VMX97_01560 [Hyphomicrobiaceae bacterium]|nr:hypothetical protein [Hyphomicrobiaceae bacterium]
MSRKAILKTLIIVLVVLIAYGIASYYHNCITEARNIRASCTLKEIAVLAVEFHEKQKRYPASCSEIPLDKVYWIDPVSRKPWQWHPGAEYRGTEVLAWQPEPYRTWLWPFGHFERRAALKDGDTARFDYGLAVTRER